jgi:hypothetical protein
MKLPHLLPLLAALAACETSLEEEEAPQPIEAFDAPAGLTRTIGADEALAVAQAVADLYRPAAAAHQAEIRVIPRWDDPAWSVHTEVSAGRIWSLYPHGGILTEDCTRDTMQWVTCHEIGHFFGGFPFHGVPLPVPSIDDTATFISSEGTADYFSSKDCLRRVWADDPDNAAYVALVPEAGRAACDAAWDSEAAREICYRTIVVAKKAMHWIQYSVDISTPDPTVVTRTLRGHFGGQCRFDTVVAGALCGAPSDLSVIPGLVPSPVTGLYGDHSVASEQQARPYACHGDDPGARPRCWFAPDMPDLQDCSGFPDGGMCDGDTVVACSPRDGVQRFPCEEGCIFAEDPDTGQRYATCAEWQ